MQAELAFSSQHTFKNCKITGVEGEGEGGGGLSKHQTTA